MKNPRVRHSTFKKDRDKFSCPRNRALRLPDYLLPYTSAGTAQRWQRPRALRQRGVIRSYLGHREQKCALIKTSLTALRRDWCWGRVSANNRITVVRLSPWRQFKTGGGGKVEVGEKSDIWEIAGWREGDSGKLEKSEMSDCSPARSNWVCRDQCLGTEK